MQTKLFPKSLSLIIPLYNEAVRFPEQFIILKQLHNQHVGWEIILVDDGSTDNTKAIINQKITHFSRMKLISYPANHGKGYAIKRGVKLAVKDLVLFSDIDFSTPISELALFQPFIEKNADMVIGTRKVHGATITAHQPSLREWLGKRFTQLSNTILGLDISDFTCGFKLFRKETAKKLFLRMKINRWGFDSEILYLANKYHYKIYEVPVIWRNDARTKVSLLTDIYKSFFDLVKIKINDLMSTYN